MHRFRYWITLEEGYKPVGKMENEKEVVITIEAKNRITADRMIKALITDSVVEYSGICID